MELVLIVAFVIAIAFVYSVGVAGTKSVIGSDFYSVSKDGRVLSGGKKVACLRPKIMPEGLIVTLRNGSRTGEFPVHVLVAEAHLPNPKGRSSVRHKDGNIKNNNVANLEWQ